MNGICNIRVVSFSPHYEDNIVVMEINSSHFIGNIKVKFGIFTPTFLNPPGMLQTLAIDPLLQ